MGWFLVCLGAACALAAAALSISAWSAERHARSKAETALRTLTEQLAVVAMPSAVPEDGEGWPEPLSGARPTAEPGGADDEIKSVRIGGRDYIGRLEIPALALDLPILREWSYEGLRVAPCRFAGRAQEGSLILIAHNYRAHFGALRQLRAEDRVTFTDVCGVSYDYRVCKTETLAPEETDALFAGEWDLTLLTCVRGGARRVVVRCARTEERR